MMQALSRLVFLVFCALILTACGGGTGDDSGSGSGAGTGTQRIGSVSLFKGADGLTANGSASAVLRATVLDTDDVAMSGVAVAFASTLGTLSGASSVTGADGVAEVTLTSPTSIGAATIQASAGGVLSDQDTVSMVAGAPSAVVVQAAPATVRPGDAVNVRATVTDSNSNPVSGAHLTYSVVTNASGGGFTTLEVTADVNGQATLSYVSGAGVGTDVVKVVTDNAISGTGSLVVSASAVVVKSISVVTGANSITADGVSQTIIRATVLNTNDQPATSIPVSFVTTLGVLSTPVVTNSDGIAEVTLTSVTTAGVADVIVSASGFLATTSVELVAGAPSAVSVVAAPATIKPDGTTSVTATVVDVNGNPVGDSEVSFSITTATSGGALGAVSATTNANGEAVVSYAAGAVTGTDVIQAQTANVKTGSVNIVVSSSSVIVKSVTLLAGASAITADGVDSVVIRATVLDTSDNAAPGVTVAFRTTLGAITTSVVTDADGIAEATLTSGIVAGSATVTATASGFSSSTSVTFIAGVPVTATVVAAPSTILPNGTTSVTATIVDLNSNPVANEAVTFAIATNNSGGALAFLTRTTDANGQVIVGYTAGATTGGTDTLRATTANTTTSTVDVTVSTGQVSVGAVSLFSGAAAIEADGLSTIVVRATVTDTNGETLGGKTVIFATSAGSFTTANPVTTDNFGEAEITLQSSANLGAAVVSATSEGVAATAVVMQFVAGNAAVATLTASPASVVSNGQTTLLATIVDSNGHAVANEAVTFAIDTNTSSGQLINTTGTTDTNGRASVLYTAGPLAAVNPNFDVLSVTTANAVSGSVQIEASASSAVLGSLAFTEVSGSGSLVADGASSTLFRVTLLSSGNLPVQGASVSIVTNAGDFNSASSGTQTDTVVTNSSGEADILLYSRTLLQQATLVASIGGLSQSVQIDFVAGPAVVAGSSLTASPSTLPADGVSTTTVTAVLVDAGGHLVADGTPVTLQSTAGTITANSQVISNGRAVFELTAASAQAIATLSTAELSGLTATVNFGATADGTPANILTSVATPALSVAGVGKIENTPITLTVLQSDGSPIDEALWVGIDTIRVSFVSKPNGGEFLSGVGVGGSVSSTSFIDVLTIGGSVQVNLQSGSLPGIVELRVEAYDNLGVLSGVAAVVPQISIASGPAHTIVLTSPITNSVENLGGGVYRRTISAVVTDRFGNAVVDGTPINLGLIDRIIATDDGEDDGTTTATSTTFADASPKEADGSAVNFNTATILLEPNTSIGTQRGIEANDRILIIDAQAEDKNRFISSAGNSSVEVQTAFNNTEAALTYVIGASLNGANIGGLDSDGNFNAGTATSVNGVADIRMVYPANVNTILLGSSPSVDSRYSPLGSADVYIVASSNDSAATTISSQFGYAAIAGFTLVPTPSALGGSGTVSLLLRDGGDTIPLPLVGVGASVKIDTRGTYNECTDPALLTEALCLAPEAWIEKTSDFNVTATSGSTNISGVFGSVVTVTGSNIQPGDAATITYFAGDATATVTVTM